MAVIKQRAMASRLIVLLVMAISLAAGALIAYDGHQFDTSHIVNTAILVLATSQVFYRTIGKHLGLPELEEKTQLPSSGESLTESDLPTLTLMPMASPPVYDPTAITAEPGPSSPSRDEPASTLDNGADLASTQDDTVTTTVGDDGSVKLT
jgi:hypothetical protein